MGYFGEQKEDTRDNIGWILLVFFFLISIGGPMAVAEKSKESWVFKVFLWVLIRAFWFGAGALTVYLCTQE